MEVVSVRAGIGFSTAGHREEQPHFEGNARLELKAKMDEAIRGVFDMEITLYPKDDPTVGTNPVHWIGLIHGFKPVVRCAVFMPEPHFDRLWVMAMGGLLKHASLWMTTPHYQSAYVTTLEFSPHSEAEPLAEGWTWRWAWRAPAANRCGAALGRRCGGAYTCPDDHWRGAPAKTPFRPSIEVPATRHTGMIRGPGPVLY